MKALFITAVLILAANTVSAENFNTCVLLKADRSTVVISGPEKNNDIIREFCVSGTLSGLTIYYTGAPCKMQNVIMNVNIIGDDYICIKEDKKTGNCASLDEAMMKFKLLIGS